MAQIVRLFFQLWSFPALVAAGMLWEATSRRFLPGKPGKLPYLARLVVICIAVIGPMWIGDENLLFFLPALIGLFLLCYQGSRLSRTVVGIVFYLLLAAIGMLLDSAHEFIPIHMWGVSEAIFSTVKLAVALLVHLLARKLNPGKKALELPERLWGLCGLLSLAPLFMVLSFSLWNNSFRPNNMDAGQYRIAYTVLPFVLLSALALLAAMVILSRQQALERAAGLATMRALYYEELQTRETQLRTLRHDLRNHLGAVEGLLSRGETAQAQRYLTELTDSPALHGTKRICENELANVVLTGKLEEMVRCGLLPDVLVTLPKELPIAETDLCALLGNALDNAIAGAAAAPDKNITVRARADCGMLMLRVANSVCALPVMEGGIPRTTKPNPKEHGFGIRGMQEIAARYGGTLETTAANGRFELIACLPFPVSCG